MTYDSTEDTKAHIHRVQTLMLLVIMLLEGRAREHDAAKLEDPEKAIFDRVTPRLRESAYLSDEYKGYLKSMKVALDHHYSTYRHHPEHFENGIHGMNLLDLIEMVVDWKAAGERHDDGGNLRRSIELNQERFGYSDELKGILLNTAEVFE